LEIRQTKNKKLFTKRLRMCLTLVSNFGKIEYQQKLVIKNEACLRTQKRDTMSNITAPQVGSPFTTAVSKVSGIVQEVVANKNGTFRARLDVNGQSRWTTIK
jgi:hypothetical protein